METNKIKEEIFKNAKRLTKIEKELWTCRENYFGKTYWKRLAKREKLIAEKIRLENRTNTLRKQLT
jgi:hypothetical protein